MKKINISLIIINLILCIGVAFLFYRIYTLKKELEVSNDKVYFYEKVIEDFGIGEFIDYPDIYYNKDDDKL